MTAGPMTRGPTTRRGVRLAACCALVALATALLPCAVAARGLEDKEKVALAAAVADFDAAMRQARYEGIVGVVPPRIVDAIASKAGVPVEQLRPAMIEIMRGALAKVKLEEFAMDLAKADHRELASGAPYVVIPTRTVMNVGEMGRIAQTSHSLAIIDDGKWYLLRVDDAQQLVILREVYPEFGGVEFPRGSIEVLKK